jgi:23S rRNA (cytosine1962-C5)-methyltransferase
MISLPVEITHGWADYALIDSGHGRKFERYGKYTFIRPEAQALWSPRLPAWEADGEFIGGSDEDGGGKWQLKNSVPDSWVMSFDDVRFHASCTPFRHLAFFPDQAVQWQWLRARLRAGDAMLNLFGYTGVASLIAAKAGAQVTHVDASKKSIAAARENQQLSGLPADSVRWIVDDALKFIKREVRREKRYQLIVLDPPKFGRGPEGERWDFFEGLPELLACAQQIVDASRGAVILTSYAIRASVLALDCAMRAAFPTGTVESGEMAIAHEGDERLLPTAMFSRWTANENRT